MILNINSTRGHTGSLLVLLIFYKKISHFFASIKSWLLLNCTTYGSFHVKSSDDFQGHPTILLKFGALVGIDQKHIRQFFVSMSSEFREIWACEKNEKSDVF